MFKLKCAMVVLLNLQLYTAYGAADTEFACGNLVTGSVYSPTCMFINPPSVLDIKPPSLMKKNNVALIHIICPYAMNYALEVETNNPVHDGAWVLTDGHANYIPYSLDYLGDNDQVLRRWSGGESSSIRVYEPHYVSFDSDQFLLKLVLPETALLSSPKSIKFSDAITITINYN